MEVGITSENWIGKFNDAADKGDKSFGFYTASLLVLVVTALCLFLPILFVPIGDCVSGLDGSHTQNLPGPTGLPMELYIEESGFETDENGVVTARPNWLYYFGYGPYVAALLAWMHAKRLESFCYRTEGIEGPEGEKLPAITCKWQFHDVLWAPVMLIGGAICFLPYTLGYALVTPGYTPFSYCFLWATPVTGSMCDVLGFATYLPPEARNLKTVVAMTVVGVPNIAFCFVAMVPMLVSMFLASLDFIPSWVGDVTVPLVVIPAMDYLSHKALKPLVLMVAEKMQWSTSHLLSGYDLQRRLIITFGTIMLLSNNSSPIELGCMMCQTLFMRVAVDYPTLRKDLTSGGVPDPSSIKDKSLFQILAKPIPQEVFEEQLHLWKKVDKVKAERIYEWSMEKANAHFAMLAAPIYFCLALSVIHWLGPNKYDYYMFECFDDAHVITALMYAVIVFLWGLMIMCVDVAKVHGLDGAGIMIHGCTKHFKSRKDNYIVTGAFIGAVFTSCLYIKHDGVSMLQDFAEGVANCPVKA